VLGLVGVTGVGVGALEVGVGAGVEPAGSLEAGVGAGVEDC
jgi:hypothetical protein